MALSDNLRPRVKQFAIRVVKFVNTLPQDPITISIVWQLVRSAPSVSANYQSAGRARSRAEFMARVADVADEADETVGWLELLKEICQSTDPEFESLLCEGRELSTILQAVGTGGVNDQRARQGQD